MIPRRPLMFGPLPIRILARVVFIVAGLPKFEKNIAVTQGFFSNLAFLLNWPSLSVY
jgi:uncharacterized membrane protein YphA (DoxX/SURF4 family)